MRHYFSVEFDDADDQAIHESIHNAVQKGLQVTLPDVQFAWRQTQFKKVAIEKLIFDMMELSESELMEWEAELKIGLDIAGTGRKYLDYTIDMLHAGSSDANIADSSYLFLPSARRGSWPKQIRRVLIIFGSKDRSRKALYLQKLLSQHFSDITFYSALEETSDKKAGWNTSEYYYNYDLIITHYGITMHEALWARVPVLLINPTRYHQKLTRKKMLTGIHWSPEQSNHKVVIAVFKKFLDSLDNAVSRCMAAAPTNSKSLSALLESLSFPEIQSSTPIHTRLSDQSVVEKQKGMFHVKSFSDPTIRYDTSYFNEEYKKQYGKTYVDDFEHIYALGKQRLAVIQKYVAQGSLLDVGCAYGHFLKAACDSGFQAQGVEVSEDAVQYARDTAGLRVTHLDVSHEGLENIAPLKGFDVITMWYVLEHFHSPHSILEMILPHLRPGGIFAFSAPSIAGISARKNVKQYFHESPKDHYTHFNPWHLRMIFAELPLKLVCWYSTGHHPERIYESVDSTQTLRSIIELVSKTARLGDTFEAYFIKN